MSLAWPRPTSVPGMVRWSCLHMSWSEADGQSAWRRWLRMTGRCDDRRARAQPGGDARGADPDPVVRVRSAVVQARRLLRDPHPRLLRLERRRLGRPAGDPGEARLPPVARRRLHLA